MNRKNPSRSAQPPIDQTQPYPSPSSQTVPSYQNQPSSASNTPSQQYQQQIPQQIPQQQIPQQQQQQQQPMVVGPMQMMPQGSDMQVMMVQLMNPDGNNSLLSYDSLGTVVLQPMMVQGGQLYSMPYMMVTITIQSHSLSILQVKWFNPWFLRILFIMILIKWVILWVVFQMYKECKMYKECLICL